MGAHVPKIDSAGTFEIVAKANVMPELVLAKAYYSFHDNWYVGAGYFQNWFPNGNFNIFGFQSRQFSMVINHYHRSKHFNFDIGLGMDYGRTRVTYSNTISSINLGSSTPADQQNIRFYKPTLNTNLYLVKTKFLDLIFSTVIGGFTIFESETKYYPSNGRNPDAVQHKHDKPELLLTADAYMTLRALYVKHMGMYFQIGVQGITDHKGKVIRYHRRENDDVGQFLLIRGLTGTVIYTHFLLNFPNLRKRKQKKATIDDENGIFYNW